MVSSQVPQSPSCRAHKFGGSSLADAGRIRHVASLMLGAEESRQVVVVSAMQGTTNALIAMTNAAAARTFNVLAGEGRRVVAGFLLPG